MKTILIVDDVPGNIKLIKELLEFEKFNVKVSTNGKKALEIINNSKDLPDLIILDVIMPEMNGYEVCIELKKNPRTENIPIIFATAKDEVEDETYGFEIGAVDYISKPISSSVLLARVKTHLELQGLLTNLSNKVEEETRLRLNHEKTLLQQSKMATMGEMIDAIMHQCKQPLSIISMENQFMLMNLDNKEIDQDYISSFNEKIEFQLKHIFETMDEFRSFFRPNSLNEDFCINDTIKSTLNLVKSELVNNLIEIDCKLPLENIHISGNKNEFKHILINLLNNSKDAFTVNNIKNKNIKIILYKENEKLIMKFSDNAGGIPSSILQDIFKANTTTKDSGTGIGLYLSSQIANKMNASLSVKNIPEGCEFTFEI